MPQRGHGKKSHVSIPYQHILVVPLLIPTRYTFFLYKLHKIKFLYMFRASSAHLQEANDVNCTCMQVLVFSFSAGGRLVHVRKTATCREWEYQRLHTCTINPLNAELNPICYLLALLAQPFLHVSRIRLKSLTLRLLMSYIYGAHILGVSRSHITTHHSR